MLHELIVNSLLNLTRGHLLDKNVSIKKSHRIQNPSYAITQPKTIGTIVEDKNSCLPKNSSPVEVVGLGDRR